MRRKEFDEWVREYARPDYRNEDPDSCLCNDAGANDEVVVNWLTMLLRYISNSSKQRLVFTSTCES